MSIPAIGVLGRTISTKTERTPEAVAALSPGYQQLLGYARAVGEVIGRRGLVLLTGGSHARSELSVKHEAILGALDGAVHNSPARVFGILPDTISDAMGIRNTPTVESGSAGAPVRFVEIHTGWVSERRDPITGRTGDAYIALEGVSGTPREVVAAFAAGRPVVFLRSWPSLQAGIEAELDRQQLPRTLIPPKPVEVADAESAVQKALDAIGWGSPHPVLAGTIHDGSNNFGLPEELVRALDMTKLDCAIRHLMA